MACRPYKQMKSGHRHGAGGFTLVEFAVVLVISGLLMSALIQAYNLYLQDKNIREIYAKMDTINGAISSFQSATRRYPCPADPTLPVDHPDAGLERCDLAFALTNNTCTPSGGICRVDGARPIAAIGPEALNPVFIGGLPYRTIKTGIEEGSANVCYLKTTGKVPSGPCADYGDDVYYPNRASFDAVSMSDVLDPWGYQVTYAVTATQTDIMSFDTSFGAIGVETEHGDTVVDPAGSVHYVVISHGENHKGAYNGQGQMPYPCTNDTADARNCQNTSTFVAGLRNMGSGATYFDDILLQKSYTMSELWRFEGDAGEIIYNVNPGNVGVGTAFPQQKLDVEGVMRADALRTQLICDSGGGNCWEVTKIAGAGMTCPPPSAPGKVNIMRGIREGTVAPLCQEIDKPRLRPGQVCPADTYVWGVETNGDIVCKDPFATP